MSLAKGSFVNLDKECLNVLIFIPIYDNRGRGRSPALLRLWKFMTQQLT